MNALKIKKYLAIGRITVRNHLAYFYDFMIRSMFLLVILYVFIQLWRVTFAGVGTELIAGYSFEQIIWYLIVAEAIILSAPRLTVTIEDEVKKGDVGYKLTRPVSYVLFHYANYMGEAVVRLTVNMIVGGILGLVMFGWPQFGWGWLGFLLIVGGSLTVNYLITMLLALCAFWVEETRGLDFVYHKLLFTIGGMMLPLELFPDLLQTVCSWLPFQAVVYFTAKSVVQFDWLQTGMMFMIQLGWIALLSILLMFVYRKGVRKLNVNGG